MSKAQDTRMMILEKAAELIYRKSFQATSIDEIIATTAVTKGALFYHFPNKDEMGLAIINELMYPGFIPFIKTSLYRTGEIHKDLYGMMKDLLLKMPTVKINYGCPVFNLIEEMAPLNKPFLKALSRIIKEWQQEIEKAIRKAQVDGQLNTRHDPKAIAMYISANYGGIRNLGKIFGEEAYTSFLKAYKKYINQLD